MKLIQRSQLILAAVAITLSLAVRAQAQSVTTLAAFNGLDGDGPSGSVVQGRDGNFYGTTDIGGAWDNGTLFRVTPAGKLTNLYNFCSQRLCADGSSPFTPPIVASDGNLYGVTGGGGNRTNAGIIYRLTPEGTLTTIYSFCPRVPCPDGGSPTGLVQASDGNLYGTTSFAANSNNGEGGTIFQISLNGEYKVLYTFCSVANCMDGDFSYYPPILGSDGNLYGVTYTGGNQGGGVLWEWNTSSEKYKVLYNFCGTSGSCDIWGPYMVVRDSEGNFFGTLVAGGYPSQGALFEFTAKKQFIVLHDFRISTDWPYTGLTFANDGNLYGVGDFNDIFKVTPNGTYTTIHTLQVSEGSGAVGPILQGTDGNLYGSTVYGPAKLDGSVYKLSTGLGPLVETAPGAGKVGSPVLILGNSLSGTSSVTFNGVPADFTVESDTYIQATVPAGATSGIVSVVTPSGMLNGYPKFVVTK